MIIKLIEDLHFGSFLQLLFFATWKNLRDPLVIFGEANRELEEYARGAVKI